MAWPAYQDECFSHSLEGKQNINRPNAALHEDVAYREIVPCFRSTRICGKIHGEVSKMTA